MADNYDEAIRAIKSIAAAQQSVEVPSGDQFAETIAASAQLKEDLRVLMEDDAREPTWAEATVTGQLPAALAQMASGLATLPRAGREAYAQGEQEIEDRRKKKFRDYYIKQFDDGDISEEVLVDQLQKLDAPKKKGNKVYQVTDKNLFEPLNKATDEFFGNIEEYYKDVAYKYAPRYKGDFWENPSFKRGVSAFVQGGVSMAVAVPISLLLGPMAGASVLAGAEAGGIYDEAKAAGKSPKEALRFAMSAGIVIAALERFGLETVLGVSGKAGMRFLKGATGESTTEMMQQLVQNAIAKHGYDASRGYMDQMTESLLGGLAGGPAAMMAGSQSQSDVDLLKPFQHEDQNIIDERDILATLERKMQDGTITDKEQTQLFEMVGAQETPEVAPPVTPLPTPQTDNLLPETQGPALLGHEPGAAPILAGFDRQEGKSYFNDLVTQDDTQVGEEPGTSRPEPAPPEPTPTKFNESNEPADLKAKRQKWMASLSGKKAMTFTSSRVLSAMKRAGLKRKEFYSRVQKNKEGEETDHLVGLNLTMKEALTKVDDLIEQGFNVRLTPITGSNGERTTHVGIDPGNVWHDSESHMEGAGERGTLTVYDSEANAHEIDGQVIYTGETTEVQSVGYAQPLIDSIHERTETAQQEALAPAEEAVTEEKTPETDESIAPAVEDAQASPQEPTEQPVEEKPAPKKKGPQKKAKTVAKPVAKKPSPKAEKAEKTAASDASASGQTADKTPAPVELDAEDQATLELIKKMIKTSKDVKTKAGLNAILHRMVDKNLNYNDAYEELYNEQDNLHLQLIYDKAIDELYDALMKAGLPVYSLSDRAKVGNGPRANKPVKNQSRVQKLIDSWRESALAMKEGPAKDHRIQSILSIEEVEVPNQSLRIMVGMFKQVFGVDVVFIQGMGDIGTGFYQPSADRKQVYVSVEGADHVDMTRAMAHEVMHSFKTNNPTKYAQFKGLMLPYMKNIGAYQKAYNRLSAEHKTGDSEANLGKITDEMLADFMGEQMLNQEFFNKLVEFMPDQANLIRSVADELSIMYGKIKAYLDKKGFFWHGPKGNQRRGGRKVVGNIQAPTYITDLEITQDLLADFLATVANEEEGSFAQPAAGVQYSYKEAQMSAEARPSKNLEILPGIHNAPYDQQIAHVEAMLDILDEISAKLGLPTYAELGPGAWDGEVGAGVQEYTTIKTHKGLIIPEKRNAINLWSDIVGLILHQDAVAWHYPIYNGPRVGQNGIEFILDRPITVEETRTLYKAIIDKVGHFENAPIPSEFGVRILNFPQKMFDLMDDKLTDAERLELTKEVKQLHKQFAEDMSFAVESTPLRDIIIVQKEPAIRFQSDGELRENDWRKYGDQEYKKRIAGLVQEGKNGWTESSDIQEWITDLSRGVYSVNRGFSDQYNWGDPGPREISFSLSPSQESTPPTGPQFTLAPPVNSAEFKQFFGASQAVNEDGSPRVLYHGSKNDFKAFEARFNDGLIFFSYDPEFAANWTHGTGGIRERTVGAVMTEEQEAKLEAAHQAWYDSVDWDKVRAEQDQGNWDYFDQVRKEDPREKDVDRGWKYSTVYPVYVRAEKIFDPRKDYQLVVPILDKLGNGMDELVDKGYHKTGNWLIYEKEEVVKGLKQLGYDAMLIAESTDKNDPHNTLAVFSPEQVRSVFNQHPNEGGVEFSLSPANEPQDLDSSAAEAYEGMDYVVDRKTGKVTRPNGEEIADLNNLNQLQKFRVAAYNNIVRPLDGFINGLAHLPQVRPYMSRRWIALGELDKMEGEARKIFETLNKATKEEARAIYDFLTTRDANPSMLPAHLRSDVIKINADIIKIGEKLVERGILSQKTLDYRQDTYLPRLYLKHLLGQDIAKVKGSGKGLNLDYTKHRKDIPEKVRKMMGEIKDPAFLASRQYSAQMRDIILYDLMKDIGANREWTLPRVLIDWSYNAIPKRKFGTMEYVKNDDGTYDIEIKSTRKHEANLKNLTATELKQALRPADANAILANKGKPMTVMAKGNPKLTPWRDLGGVKWKKNKDGTYNIKVHQKITTSNVLTGVKEAELNDRIRGDYAEAIVNGKGRLEGGRMMTPLAMKAEVNRMRSMANTSMSGQEAQEVLDAANAMEIKANEVIEQIKAEHNIDLDSDSLAFTKEWAQIPNTNRYGSLRGMIVRKDIYDDLIGNINFIIGERSVLEKLFMDGGSFNRVHGYWKFSKTAANPTTHARNWISNTMLIQLGGIPPSKIIKYYPLAIKQILDYTRGKDPSTHRAYAEAKRYGLSKATFSATELVRIQNDFLETIAKETGHPMKKLMAAIGRVANLAGDAYQLGEAIGKTVIMMDSLERGMSAEQAAHKAHKWLFDYSQASRSIKYTRGAIIGSPFITFAAKVLPRMVEVAVTAPWRMLPYIALTWGMAGMLGWNTGADDDDIEKLKQSLPKHFREKGHVYFLPYKDDSGRWQVIDMGYLFPWTAWTESGMGLKDVVTGKDVLGGMTRFLSPVTYGGPVPDAINAWSTGIDPFTKRPIVPPEAIYPHEQAKSIMAFVLNSAAPSFFTNRGPLVRATQAVGGNVDKFGEPTITLTQAAWRFLGVNIYSQHPELSRQYTLIGMQRDIDDMQWAMQKKIADQNISGAERARLVQEIQKKTDSMYKDLVEYVESSEIAPELKTFE